MTKEVKSYLVIVAIFFSMANLLFFAIPFPKNAVFWISYVFSMLSIFVCASVPFWAFKNKVALKQKVYGLPIMRIAVIYLAAQLVISLLFYGGSLLWKIPGWLPIVVFSMMLGVAVIGLIAVTNVRDIIENMETMEKQNTENMIHLRNAVEELVDLCKDEEMKNNLERLLEKFTYSDPVSNQATMELEQEMISLLEGLKQYVGEPCDSEIRKLNSVDDIFGSVDIYEQNVYGMEKILAKVESTLNERNRKCKIGK